MEPDERADTLAFLERTGLAYVSRGHADDARLERRRRGIAAATHAVAYVRFHGRNEKTWNIKAEKSSRPLQLDVLGGGARGVGREARPALGREADEVYAMFNNNRDDFAPRSAMILRGLLDEAGIPASGGFEPPPLAPTLF